MTGGNRSEILGTVGTFGDSQPNLFLINPNGIIFGEDAKLDIGGSFVATTANAVALGETGLFSASEPETSNLLAINPNVFFFNQLSNQAEIVNRSTGTFPVLGDFVNELPLIESSGLQVPDGQSLLLLGGDVRLDGGVLLVPGGQVELGGLSEPGRIGLNVDGNNLSLSFPDGIALSDVSLTNSLVYVTGEGDGSIALKARNLDVSDSALFAGIGANLGSIGTQAGDIILNTTGAMTIANSIIYNNVGSGAVGNGGNIYINAGSFSLTDDAQLSASTFGQGNAGNVYIDVHDTAAIEGRVFILPNGTPSLMGAIFSNVGTGAVGNGGDINIKAGSLSITDWGQLSTSTFGRGDAGSVFLEANDSISLTNTAIFSTVEPGTVGNGGDINIKAGSLSTNFAGLSTSTFGRGNAGSVFLEANDAISLADITTIFSTVETGAVGNGGDINIKGGSLSITGGTQLVSTPGRASGSLPGGRGNSGDVNIDVRDAMIMIGGGRPLTAIFTGTGFDGAVGEGGDININAESLLLLNGAVLGADTHQQGGNAGNISIRVVDSVYLANSSDFDPNTNRGSTRIGSSVGLGATGNGGDIDIQARSLSLINGAYLNASTLGSGDAGDIKVNANTIEAINGGQILTFAGENSNGDAGSIILNISDSIALSGSDPHYAERIAEFSRNRTNPDPDKVTLGGPSSGLVARTEGSGAAGDLEITTGQLIVRDNATISAATSGQGIGGDIQIKVNSLALTDGAQATVSSTGSGTAGNLDVTADEVILNNQARLTAETESGSGGNITLQGLDNLQVRNSLISASTEDGTAGDVTVNATESVQLEGILTDGTPAGLLAEATEGGNARNLTINTRQLRVENGAQATVSSTGRGTAGNLDVTAEDVILNNQAKLTAETESGSGGNIALQGLDNLEVRNSLISASTEDGTAGDVTVNASESVQLMGNSRLAVEATSGGNAGNLTVETGQLSVRDGAGVTVSSPQGQAGNLRVTADSVTLNRGSLTAETGKSGVQGGANITLNGLDILLLQNESLISANAREYANGGNISIDANFILALMPTGLEGSDIVANAVRGNGGQVNITAPGGLFGIQFRPIRTSFNDITASSEFGSAGIVAITGSNVDPSRGLTNLPIDFEEPPLENSCRAGGKTASSFVVTGRGGLPPSPYDTLSSDPYLDSLATPVPRTEYRPNPTESTNSASPTPNTIVEAQGWIIAADGTVTLTAQAPTVTPHSPAFTSAHCQAYTEGSRG